MIIGSAVSERQENIVVNEGTNDRDFTVGTIQLLMEMQRIENFEKVF